MGGVLHPSSPSPSSRPEPGSSSPWSSPPQVLLYHRLRRLPQRRSLQRQRPQPLHRRAAHHVALVLCQQRHRPRRPHPSLSRVLHVRHHQSQMPAPPPPQPRSCSIQRTAHRDFSRCLTQGVHPTSKILSRALIGAKPVLNPQSKPDQNFRKRTVEFCSISYP